MKDNPYRAAMKEIQFNGNFEQETLKRLESVVQKRASKSRVYRYVYTGIGITACAALAITVALYEHEGTDVQPQLPSIVQPVATPDLDARTIVSAQDYPNGLSESMKGPDQGEVLLASGVQAALEDPQNEHAYFFVKIDVVVKEQYENRFEAYMYRGRSIAEWSELSALSEGTYPYCEYNGDHGGNVSEEQWREKQQEALACNAREQYEAAVAQYNQQVVPRLEKARTERYQSECERLQALGLDVFWTESWEYLNETEKTYFSVLTGILSSEQLCAFPADAQCGYVIDWVFDGDGVIEWQAP